MYICVCVFYLIFLIYDKIVKVIAELPTLQGMQALLDLISTLDGSVADTAKLLGYVCYSCVTLCFFLLYFQQI